MRSRLSNTLSLAIDGMVSQADVPILGAKEYIDISR